LAANFWGISFGKFHKTFAITKVRICNWIFSENLKTRKTEKNDIETVSQGHNFLLFFTSNSFFPGNKA